MTHHLRLLSSLTVLVLLIGGCGEAVDADEETYERPDETKGFISDNELQQLEEAGLSIFDGTTPPDIEGTYRTESTHVEYHDNEERLGNYICDHLWTFDATGDDFRYDLTRDFVDCDGDTVGDASYIAGHDDCFSLYLELTGEFEGCETANVRVLSGCMESDGIRDFQYGGIATGREGDSCQGIIDDNRLSAEGEMGIYVEQDGLATKVSD